MQMQRRVVLAVPTLSSGDAVSNDVLGMYGALLKRGVDVRVFPNELASKLSLRIIDPSQVETFLNDPAHLFIYHFCGAWGVAESLLASLKCRRVVRYHNVTPPSFFAGIDAEYDAVCWEGRGRIQIVSNWADEVWGDSSYNVSEFVDVGFPATQCSVIPPFNHTAELLATPSDPDWMAHLGDGRRNILVVGRLAPNKNHLSMVRAVAKLRETHSDVRLVIVGGTDEKLAAYSSALQQLIEDCEMTDSVLMAGKLSSAALATAYRTASVFAISSLHEGFCVPLVEAMANGVPVVALSRAAVPETLGEAGWLVEDDSPEALAHALDEALGNPEKISAAIRAGRARYERRFSSDAIEKRFLEVISSRLAPRPRRVRAVHQFHSGTAAGDAVTNSMFLTQRLLGELGFESAIFAEHVAKELTGSIRSFRDWAPSADDVLFLHHSMGHDQDEWVKTLPSTNVLVYHNITPDKFFPPESPFRHYSVKGRTQLQDFKPVFSAAFADSELNAAELIDAGYSDVDVLPLLVDTAEITSRPWNDALVMQESPVFTVLFVGRVAPNKCQQHLLAVADQLRSLLRRPFQFVFVGGYEENDPFYHSLLAEIERLKLHGVVRFAGKVPDADLYAWYRVADVFLCLSEHEGFGVPLIEAMTFDVPVIAYQSSNVGATLGGAGLLINDKHPRAVAALIRVLAEDRSLRRSVIEGQRLRIERFGHATLRAQLATFLVRQGIDIPTPPPFLADSIELVPTRLHYQVEGPFETSYSLALVNRELGLALERAAPSQTGLFATEGPGDYQPDARAIAGLEGVGPLWERGKKGSGAEVVVRNLYPPRVADMDGMVNLLYFAWEESGLNADWVRSFNANLDGMPVLSRFVEKVLRDNGVSLPTVAAGCGVDHVDRVEQVPYRGDIGEGFRFLHISSCFPRKGVDVLLEAFVQAFRNEPEVTLVIKTFPNQHNTVAQHIARLRRENPDGPRFVLIEKDLPAGQIVDLYKRCDAFVAPSRGEGFGLPMAEAMWFGKPVITTAFGGQTDFCTPETAWLVDFQFAPAETHMGLFDSVWAEPDMASLIEQLRAVRSASPAQLLPRLERARELMERDFTWDRCASRMHFLESAIRAEPALSRRKLKVAWVSSWNSKCGIASYTEFLTAHLDPASFDVHFFASYANETIVPDTPQVTRCWSDLYGKSDLLLAQLKQYQPDVVVLQHSFGFFSHATTVDLIRFANQRNIPISITFHSTKDATASGTKISLTEIIEDLKFADRLLVHGIDDLNRLRGWNLIDNAAIMPHGVHRRQSADVAEARRAADLPVNAKIVATYGFLLPHKGLEQMIEAFATIVKRIPDAYLLMVNALYPAPESEHMAAQCRARIKALGLENRIRMVTEFLPDRESFAYLDAADLVVFPYQATAESSSAAARYGMASNRPVVCSPLRIFDDLNGTAHQLPGTSADDIASGVVELLGDETLRLSKAAEQQAWLEAKSWERVSARLAGMLVGLFQAKKSTREDRTASTRH
jgi:glycosyltransferase involved in cell wall biosynthesis